MKSEHLMNAGRIDMVAEALAARTRAAVRNVALMWGLMYTATGLPYYAELCVGSEAEMREEAQNHNRCAREADAGDDELICAVPLWLREGGTHAITKTVWRCDSCGHLHEANTHILCNGCFEIHPMTGYKAVLHRAHG